MGVLKRTLVGILALLGLASTATGQNSTEASQGVNGFFGSFSTEIPIEVPPFHGIQPRIKLVYNSGSQNGWVGVGWNAAATSIVQRTSARRGAPKYDTTDIYMIDGMELVPCTTQGGTHCTRIQNFARVERNEASDHWTATGTNGNVAVYEPLLSIAEGTFRWALTSVTDPLGHTVDYEYWCDGQDCYLDRISYTGAEIQFLSETRPDPIPFGNGKWINRTNYRLKAIDVRVFGSTARAYQLDYDTGSSTGRSRLINVQLFGNDALVNGTQISGTSFPPQTHSYQELQNANYGGGPAWATILNNGGNQFQPGQTRVVDISGDGFDDLIFQDDLNAFHVALSTGTDFSSPQTPTIDHGGGFEAGRAHYADVNGDGRSDLIFQGNSNEFYVSLSDGSNFLPGAIWEDHDGSFVYGQAQFGDANGDGLADLIFQGNDNAFNVSLSSGTDFMPSSVWGQHGGDFVSGQAQYADFNGDGMIDLAMQTDNGPTLTQFHIWLSDGTQFVGSPSWGGHGEQFQPGQAAYADVNGDGMSDLIFHANNNIWWVNLSRGTTFDGANHWFSQPGSSEPGRTGYGDFNGDGRVDISVQLSGTGQQFLIGLSNGLQFVHSGAWIGHGGGYVNGAMTYGDVNGDRLTDFVYRGGSDYWVNNSLGEIPDLLSAVDNGRGGSTQVVYDPSTRWNTTPGTELPLGLIQPVVSSVISSDGRTNPSTTDYFYEGAKWESTERRFLGFHTTTEVMTAVGSYAITEFLQNAYAINKPAQRWLFGPNDELLSGEMLQYTENTENPPFTSLLTSRWQYECNGVPTITQCRETRIDFAYDIYGNVYETVEHGDTNVIGDERMRTRGHFPNTVDYLVGFPAFEEVFEGMGDPGTLLLVQRSENLYDGNTAIDQPPTDGLVTSKRRLKDGGGFAESFYTYDSHGNVKTEADERGHQTTYQWDTKVYQYETSRCNGFDHCVTETHDLDFSTVRFSTDENGIATEFRYDALGRIVDIIRVDGTNRSFQYLDTGDPNLQRVRETAYDGTPDGLWTEKYQDGLGRVFKTVREGPIEGGQPTTLVQETIYDGSSTRALQRSLWHRGTESPRFVTFSYDAALRPRIVTNPDLSERETLYGLIFGIPVETRSDENGNQTIYLKDAYGRTAAIFESDGETTIPTTFNYDSLDRVVSTLTDKEITVTWNLLGERTELCDPNFGCVTHTYEAGGLLAVRTDAKNQTLTYDYDAIGRVRFEASSDGDVHEWRYDEANHGYSAGRLTTILYPAGSESFEYDTFGRETAVTRTIAGAGSKTFLAAYGATSRLESLTYPDSEIVTYQYDESGRLSSVPGYAPTLEWSPSGQLRQIEYANGTTSRFDYDQDRLWLDRSRVDGPRGNYYDVSYEYDVGARLVTSNSTLNPEMNLGYQYDPLNRLIGVTGSQSQSFDYGTRGNTLYNSSLGDYFYEAAAHPHAVTRVGDKNYQYDTNGNLKRMWLSTGSGSCGQNTIATLTWSGRDRLESIDKLGALVEFAYDSENIRVRKTTATGSTYYFGDILEVLEDGTEVKYYNAAGILIAKRVGSDPFWFHADRLGSPKLITDAQGQIASSFEYSSFGEETTMSGSMASGRGYTGHRLDSETGLVYMNARYYDPELGRFISSDDFVPNPNNPQTFNKYAYADNNPISNVDPSGNNAKDIITKIAAVFLAVFLPPGYALLVGVIGLGLSIAGFATENPTLVFIGQILLGVAATNLVGGNLLSPAGNPGTSPGWPHFGGTFSDGGTGNTTNKIREAVDAVDKAREISQAVGEKRKETAKDDAAANLALDQLRKYNPISVETDTEYGGFIYEFGDGTLGATPSVSSPCLGGTSCELPLGDLAESIPDDASIILDWHTHGAAPATNPMRWERFSRNDVMGTNQLGSSYGTFRGSYLGTPQGRVYFLPPGRISGSQWSERAIRQAQQYQGRIPR